SLLFFFFQAEDGIRDKLVTGVQTCALPICFYSAPGKCLSIPLAYANQKLKLALSCVMRAGIRVVVTRPKSELLTLPEGLLNCAWLNALNRSTRSWSFIFSVMLVSL